MKALRASYKGATEPDLRTRLWECIQGIRRTYGLPREPTPQDMGDLKRKYRVPLIGVKGRRVAPQLEIIDPEFDR